ncbi:MAG: glycosyltransferase [Candidatus Omnitrophica bacterium]|nr:glycosyltransferase [Candidatus Omnitrophota bacterium]
MKILMVSNTYTPIVGGVERSIQSFTREYQRLGHDVLILTLEYDGAPCDEKGVVRIPALRRFNGSDFSVRLPIPVNLSGSLDEFKPDIIHSHHPIILGDTALRIANKYKAPIVFTHHTKYEDYTHYVPLDSPELKKFVIELTTGYANLVDCVIAPSQSIKQMLLERGVKKPIEMIPTGVDCERFRHGDGLNFRNEYKINSNDFLVGHVGRLAVEKNLIFLVKSVITFLKYHSHARFLLVGSGPSLAQVKDIFKKEKLEDRLVLTGALEGQELIDAYHAMDVFAFSSKTETQGIVLLEALAAGDPVVALDATGVRDFIKDRLTGRIVFRENTEDFCEALDWVFGQDKHLEKELKNNARQTAASFSLDRMASQFIDLYKSLLKKRFVSFDIENSPWVSALGRIKVERDLISNYAEAVGAVIKDKIKEKRFSKSTNNIKEGRV